jgi:signal peptidase I
MRNTLRFLLALAVSLALLLVFRTLALTIYIVEGEGLEPEFVAGDHVMVSRWSYGLRTGGAGSIFPYGRLLHRQVSRGDIVAYEDPTDSTARRVLLGRCQALPGDTVGHDGRMVLVPSLQSCADADYYWIAALGSNNPTDSRQLGFISEQRIIGRTFLVVYNHAADAPFWRGWRTDRLLIGK